MPCWRGTRFRQDSGASFCPPRSLQRTKVTDKVVQLIAAQLIFVRRHRRMRVDDVCFQSVLRDGLEAFREIEQLNGVSVLVITNPEKIFPSFRTLVATR